MGKHRTLATPAKKRKRRKKPPADESKMDLLERNLSELEVNRTHLVEMQEALTATLARDRCSVCGGCPNAALARESASVARTSAAVSKEVRSVKELIQKLEVETTRQELVALIADYLEELEPADRAQIRERLEDLEETGGLLAQ